MRNEVGGTPKYHSNRDGSETGRSATDDSVTFSCKGNVTEKGEKVKLLVSGASQGNCTQPTFQRRHLNLLGLF